MDIIIKNITICNNIRMPDKRTHYIGARFTKREKDSIKKAADGFNITLSTLVRQAVFSHLNILEDTKGKNETVDIILVKHKSKLLNPTPEE